MEKTDLTLGFIALTDCAPLVVAKEKGFFASQGLTVTLERQASWAAVRDKVAIGALDGAHMLAAMPIAMMAGAEPVQAPMIATMGFVANSAAITISQSLWERMAAAEPGLAESRASAGGALRRMLAMDRAAGRPKPAIAVVSTYSIHNYLLRYWLAAHDIHPDRDLRIVVVPPQQMVANLSVASIDGFCVGEPWHSLAAANGIGRMAARSRDIWANGIDKVFGVTADWADRHPDTLQSVLRALLQAALWADHAGNREEVARILAQPHYVNAPYEAVAPALKDPSYDFSTFRYGATFPWRSQAEWCITQMIRWGQLPVGTDIRGTAERAIRPDLYRQAARSVGLPYPLLDRKVEGLNRDLWILTEATAPIVMGPDTFLDSRHFDPDLAETYLAGFEIRTAALPHASILKGA